MTIVPGKMLIIQTAFLGDAILASSLLEKLHSAFPDSSLALLVRKGNEGCYEDHPFLKKLLVWDKKKEKRKGLFRLLKEIRKEKFDVVVNVQRFASTGILTGFSGAKQKIGFKKNPFSFLFTKRVEHNFGDGSHEIARNQKLIQHFTDPIPAKPKLYPSERNFRKIENYCDLPFVTMAPASVWFTKALPLEKWVELSNTLGKQKKIYLIGGPSDFDLCEEIRKKSIHQGIENLCGKLDSLDTCALVSKATMNYVNDSAPLHFCSAMNAPVSAFFCSTLPSFGFYPLSDDSNIIEIKHKLDCRPCGIHGLKTCPKGHFKCGYEIDLVDNK